MKTLELPEQDYLKSILEYDPDTGVFVWKVRTKQGPAGIIAGRVHARGYIHIYVGSTAYKAHRLAFKIMTGRDPADGLDHWNGNPADNRFVNLRESDQTYNNANTQLRIDNKSGVKGVCCYELKGYVRWKAQWSEIGGARKSKYFPYTPEGLTAAEQFIKTKRRELYGEFANDGEHRDAPV